MGGTNGRKPVALIFWFMSIDCFCIFVLIDYVVCGFIGFECGVYDGCVSIVADFLVLGLLCMFVNVRIISRF
ncbi:hypothetical protein [Pseudomonas savastanoi]|uniref:hypothetical protein n=1 Tax=Pseudomonas savastanoi TaxID=29438 RepID=UPI0016053F69|nr:hypothetical protein [Pseudomonas savastanoi]